MLFPDGKPHAPAGYTGLPDKNTVQIMSKLGKTGMGAALGIALILVGACAGGCRNAAKGAPGVSDTLALNFLNVEQAAAFLGSEDHHTRSLDRFALEGLTGRKGATSEDFRRFAAEQAREWTPEARRVVQEKTDSLNDVILQKQLDLNFPERIDILVSTLREEGEADGYTRGKTIVCNERMLALAPPYMVTSLIAHEAFHVLTRNNPDLRRRLYALIGFTVLPRTVELPAGLAEYVIDNPDVNAHDSYATFTIDGRQRDCIMLLYSKRDYEGGGFWSYFSTGLLEIDPETCRPVLDENGQWHVYEVEEAVDFFDKVGRNTDYVLDPEEVLADNFSFLLTRDIETMPSPELLRRMEAVCRGEE